MSLATRCTECGTVFRVVQDQLKVSEGWVRCGRCSSVFNALEALFDLDADAPPVEPTPTRRVLDELAAHRPPQRPPQMPPPLSDDWTATRDAPAAATVPAAPGGAPAMADAAAPVWSDPAAAAGPAAAAAPADEPPLTAALLLDPAPSDDAPAAIVALSGGPPLQIDADETIAPPQFVRAADRAAFWRRPLVRSLLAAAAVMLAAAAALQLAIGSRDLLAAHVPASRPLLQRLCELSGCRLEPLRRIERLSVDSSGLTRLEGAPLYRLSLVLHNRADTPLRMPALDLALTDSQGKLVARRVLQPAELGVTSEVLEPGQELPLQAVLGTGERRVSGYTVELFYP